MSRKSHQRFVLVYDLVLIALSYYLSFYIMFGFSFDYRFYFLEFSYYLPIIIFIYLGLLFIHHLFLNKIYVSLSKSMQIACYITLSYVLTYMILNYYFLVGFPNLIYFLSFFMSGYSILLVRFLYFSD